MAVTRTRAAQSAGALALANARYWTSVALHVRRAMRHWESRARAIVDPELRELALSKLHAEGFNAEAAAMAATLAPRPHRRHAVEAIVALELLFDYLDGVTERPLADPVGDGERLFDVFIAALAPSPPILPTTGVYENADGRGGTTERTAPAVDDGAGPYMRELADAVRRSIAHLPAGEAVADAAMRCAVRSAQAQIRMHAAPHAGTDQLSAWATAQASGTSLQWREFLAGAASSVLALHALIAAAADPRTTPEHADQIERAYLSICVVVTMLDGLVDHHDDAREERLSYAGLYEDTALLAMALGRAAREAARQSQTLPNSAHHLMTLASAIAYWSSAPGARNEPARPVLMQIRRDMRSLLWMPMLAIRAWRLARQARGGRARSGERTPSC